MTADGQLMPEDASDHALPIYEVGNTLWQLDHKGPLHVVELDHSLVGVGGQRKGDIVCFLEPSVALYRVRADSDQNGVLCFDGFIVVTEATDFGRSAGVKVFRIKVQDYVLLP